MSVTLHPEVQVDLIDLVATFNEIYTLTIEITHISKITSHINFKTEITHQTGFRVVVVDGGLHQVTGLCVVVVDGGLHQVTGFLVVHGD